MKKFTLRAVVALLIVFGAINDAPQRVTNYTFAARMVANAHSRLALSVLPVLREYIVFRPAIENNL